MAKIEPCTNSDLSIHLDWSQPFLPGQKITGYVPRTSRWASAETSISIALHGKCTTKFFSRDSYMCRSSLDLFGQEEVRYELFNDPLHIQLSCPEGKMWRHPEPTSLRSHPLGRASYLPLLYVDKQALPPSFDLGSSNATTSRNGSAVVEYYLEAMITTPNSEPVMARMPIHLRCQSSPFPITDFDIQIHSRQRYTINSPYLISAGTETVQCSMGQKLGKVVGLSRSHRFTFRLDISVASVLQIGSPYHIPLEMRAIPQWEDTSECLSKTLPTIDIISFTLVLRSTSCILAFATAALGPAPVVREESFMEKILLADYIYSKSTKQIEERKYSSLNDSNSLTLPVNENTAPLDIGEVLDLKLQHEKFSVHEVPTFITYNIKRTYELEWKMRLEVGGETIKVKGKHPVLVMGRAG
ncbi:conserved hypothetical protein [Talaromyces stipitatus ATCC 10500]|uniref:Arrestin-like N-terminal domain-containing protein n=1 Tax=Talaromyces stipitatus (strain ATCC 10500 / CBS 375.48 / QM 6759 / NRRL 1006) TaxID=441959 RepID=B8MI92_TALSN|nr:uncharacterized protein TSTA_040560 [Talaromyces stipitatus ATCC 10500]EED14576.1 conserved hypothetical protein [Talaromyces stipitatus ATCC 10500]